MQETFDIQGSGGGKSASGSTYTPTEVPNNMLCTATAYIIEVLCEGRIKGLVDSTRSVFLDDTPLTDDAGNYNFNGCSFQIKRGVADQEPIPWIKGVESEVNVNLEIKQTIPRVLLVEDGVFDDLRLTYYTPAFIYQDTKGNINNTSVELKIEIQPDGGNYQTVNTFTMTGKTNRPYERQVVIKDVATTYGAGPWLVRLSRLTADSTASNVQNSVYILSYATVLNERFSWDDVAYAGIQIDAKQFGSSIPTRSYEIYGKNDLLIPSNYDPDTRVYTGIWDGTFLTGYTDNPAWVYYDLITNNRYGLGASGQYQLGVTAQNVDKWTLYEIAKYCDELVADGYGGYEPRFTCNAYISTQQEAFHLLNAIASTFLTMPYYGSGTITFSQDAPAEASHIANPSNVIDGNFQYSGTSLDSRHSVVYVTWNDPDDAYRAAIEVVEDPELIATYGWRQKDVVAIGCTSRGQARRYGKWLLDTEKHQQETVSFRGGFDFIDCYPGCIIKIQDPAYAGIRYGGRIGAQDDTTVPTTTAIPIDSAIVLESGKEYRLSVVIPCEHPEYNVATTYAQDVLVYSSGIIFKSLVANNLGNSVRDPLKWAVVKLNIEERVITTTQDGLAHSLLTVTTPFSVAPERGAIWVVSVVDYVEPRLFRCLINKENKAGEYEITAIYHDPDKYARIESGLAFDPVPDSIFPTGAIEAISGLTATDFAYTLGNNYAFGAHLAWNHSSDPRVQYYDIQYSSETTGTWAILGYTEESAFDKRDLQPGTYNFRVRGRGLGVSPWTELLLVDVGDPNTLPPEVTNVALSTGESTYTGNIATIVWDDMRDTDEYPKERHKDYKVEFCTADGVTVERIAYVIDEIVYYTTGMLLEDFTSPPRTMLVRIITRDIYGRLSDPVSFNLTKHTPSMAGYTPTVSYDINGILIDWSASTISNQEISGFDIYCDTSATPTTKIASVSGGTRTYAFSKRELAQTTYYVKIVPRDVCGVGTASSVGSAIVYPDDSLVFVTDVASGSKITSDEKYRLKPVWANIKVEAETSAKRLPAQANAFGVDHTAYDNAYSALKTYVQTTLTLFTSMTTSTTIDRDTWDSNWSTYYTEEADLRKAIADKAKTLADAAQATADASMDLVDAVNDDGKVAPAEKKICRRQWNAIVLEGKTAAPDKGTICVQADKLSVDRSAFNDAYTALDTYLNTNLQLFSDMSTKTVLSEARTAKWDLKWNNYYNAKVALEQAISDKASTLANWSTVASTPANLAALAGTEAIQNTAISISAGALSGIGTGDGTVVANSEILVNSSGVLENIGTTGIIVDNDKITASNLVGAGKIWITSLPADGATKNILTSSASMSPPSNPTTGDQWYQDDTKTVKSWNGTSWDTWSTVGAQAGVTLTSSTGTVLNDAAIITSQGTAAAIANQGTLATRNTIDLGESTLITGNLVASRIASGTITAALLLSGSIKTATTGARFEITPAAITGFDASNNYQVQIQSSTGGLIAGAGAVSVNGQGIKVAGTTNALLGGSDPHSITFGSIPATIGTSTSSVAFPGYGGDHTFVTQAGLGFAQNNRLKLVYRPNPEIMVFGIVQSYSGTSLVIYLYGAHYSTNGTYSDWLILPDYNSYSTIYASNNTTTGQQTFNIEQAGSSLKSVLRINSIGFCEGAGYERELILEADACKSYPAKASFSSNENRSDIEFNATATTIYGETDMKGWATAIGGLFVTGTPTDHSTLEVIGTSAMSSWLSVGGIIYANSDIEFINAPNGVVFKSSDGSRWRLRVNNSGVTVIVKL